MKAILGAAVLTLLLSALIAWWLREGGDAVQTPAATQTVTQRSETAYELSPTQFPPGRPPIDFSGWR